MRESGWSLEQLQVSTRKSRQPQKNQEQLGLSSGLSKKLLSL
jgi:hypothetical protein